MLNTLVLNRVDASACGGEVGGSQTLTEHLFECGVGSVDNLAGRDAVDDGGVEALNAPLASHLGGGETWGVVAMRKPAASRAWRGRPRGCCSRNPVAAAWHDDLPLLRRGRLAAGRCTVQDV